MRNEELVFDHNGDVDVEALREFRECPRTQYEPPPGGQKWWAGVAVFYAGLSKTEMIALHWLIEHANPKTGRCDPSQACGAWETGLPKRTLERALKGLRQTPYLQREQRGHRSNAYFINWAALRRVFESWEARKSSWRVQRDAVKSGEPGCHDGATNKTRPVRSGDSDPVRSGGSFPSEVADEHTNELSRLNINPKGDDLPKGKCAHPVFENQSSENQEIQSEPRFREEVFKGRVVQPLCKPTQAVPAENHEWWKERLVTAEAALAKADTKHNRENVARLKARLAERNRRLREVL